MKKIPWFLFYVLFIFTLTFSACLKEQSKTDTEASYSNEETTDTDSESWLERLGLFKTNPLTGKKTMAFVDNSSLFPQAFQAYAEFIENNTVIDNTPEAAMLQRVGDRLKKATEQWLAAEGQAEYLAAYEWEYRLIQNEQANAWCMPGGKIAVYTGILPATMNEQGLAVVMGHEIAHALLNHSQQRMSAGVLHQIGAIGTEILTSRQSGLTRVLARFLYDAGSNLLGVLPFSRSHESEADLYGLILMTIAGYDPEEAVPFWQRMSEFGSGAPPEFLSTHPSDATRIQQLNEWVAIAKEKAQEIK